MSRIRKMIIMIMLAIGIAGVTSQLCYALEDTGNSTWNNFINDSRFTDGVSWPGGKEPVLRSYTALGCCAYCCDYVKYCYNINDPRNGTVFYDANEIRPGDVLTVGNPYDGSGHWFICFKRNGNNLYVAEGNGPNGHVRIGWNYTASGVANDPRGFTAGYHFATPANHDPEIHFDGVDVSYGKVRVSGWAYDPDNASKSIEVHAYLFQNGNATMIGSTTANVSRTDVDNALHIGQYHGFDATFSTDMRGQLEVQVAAINIDQGSNQWSDKKNITITETVANIESSVYSLHSALNNNLVLDVADGKKTNGTNIQTQNYHGGPAQRFHIVNRGGYYTIQAQCSDLFVDTEGNSSISGANIFTWGWTGATGQKWEFIDAGDGYYYIRSKNGMYLDVTDGINSIQVNIQSCRFFGGPAQKWKLVEEKRIVNVEEGVYSIHSAINNNLVIDVADGKKTNGTNIQTQNYHGGPAQRFKVIKKGDYYAIQAQCSNLLIDTEGNSTESGANIFTWSDTGANGQRWQFIDAGEGYYFIQSKNEMFVDVTDGVNSIQTNIQSCRFFGGPAQRWKLVREHEHDLVRYPYKEATTSAAGNIEYWKCSSCSKIFKDALGNNEISISDTLIPKKQDPSGGSQPSTGGGSQIGGSQTTTKNQPAVGSQQAEAEKEPITITKAPASVKAKVKKNKVTVSWKKLKKTNKVYSKVKSIQIQYSTNPKFETNCVTKKVSKSKTKLVLKLKKKKTYFIRVRYVGKDGYSKWTKAKRVKTK